jgi:hypothetical protein
MIQAWRAWVFTDERRNLLEEPFVAGVPEIITEIVADIPNAKEGFRLTFSAGPFPGHELVATRGEPESGAIGITSRTPTKRAGSVPLFNSFPRRPRNTCVPIRSPAGELKTIANREPIP